MSEGFNGRDQLPSWGGLQGIYRIKKLQRFASSKPIEKGFV